MRKRSRELTEREIATRRPATGIARLLPAGRNNHVQMNEIEFEIISSSPTIMTPTRSFVRQGPKRIQRQRASAIFRRRIFYKILRQIFRRARMSIAPASFLLSILLIDIRARGDISNNLGIAGRSRVSFFFYSSRNTISIFTREFAFSSSFRYQKIRSTFTRGLAFSFYCREIRPIFTRLQDRRVRSQECITSEPRLRSKRGAEPWRWKKLRERPSRGPLLSTRFFYSWPTRTRPWRILQAVVELRSTKALLREPFCDNRTENKHVNTSPMQITRVAI